MHEFIATVVPGTEDLVAGWLSELRSTKVTHTESGFVAFKTEHYWKKFQNIRYLSNCFLVIASGRAPAVDKGAFVNLLTRKFSLSPAVKEFGRGKKTFRIVCAIENEMVTPPREAVRVAESKIMHALRLTLSVKAPSIEFWMMIRRDGRYYYALRISALRKENKDRTQGELRSEVANIMIRLSTPKSHDVVYDPFCGRGTLLAERGYYAPYAHLYGSDIDQSLVASARKKLERLENITVTAEDSLHSSLPDNSISSILTDPPWGLYDTSISPEHFYSTMLRECARVLQRGKTAVILSAAREAMQHALIGGAFTLLREYHLLISGKKATLYVLKKP